MWLQRRIKPSESFWVVGVLSCHFGGVFFGNNHQQESYLTAKKEVRSVAFQTKCRCTGGFKLSSWRLFLFHCSVAVQTNSGWFWGTFAAWVFSPAYHIIFHLSLKCGLGVVDLGACSCWNHCKAVKYPSKLYSETRQINILR